MFDTASQIYQEVEFGGKYVYVRANNQQRLPGIIGHADTNIYIYCNKICDNNSYTLQKFKFSTKSK